MDPAILLLIVVFVLAPSVGMFMLASARTPTLLREILRALEASGRPRGPAFDDGVLAAWVPWRVPAGLEAVLANPEAHAGAPVRAAVAAWRANRRLALIMLVVLASDLLLLAAVVLWLSVR